MKNSLSGGFPDIGSNIKTGDRMISFHDAFFQFQNQDVDVSFFSLVHGKAICHVPLGDDQQVPVGDWIAVLYRYDRILFGDYAIFNVIVTKRAIFHLNKLGHRFARIGTDLQFFLTAY